MPWKKHERWRDVTSRLRQPYKSTLDYDSRLIYIARPRLAAKKVQKRLDQYFQDGFFDTKCVFEEILPVIDRLVLEAPETFKGVTIQPLPIDSTRSIAYTRREVATLIALMWYNLLDYDYMMVGDEFIADIDNYGQPNLQTIWDNDSNFFIDCLFNYFRRVGEMSIDYEFDMQRIIFRRYASTANTDYSTCTNSFTQLSLGDGDSDRSTARLHVISASSTVGGRGFKNAPTHEEIVMMTRPESLALLLFGPHPAYKQMNVVIGAEQMSLHAGIATTVRFVANYNEPLPVAEIGSLSTYQIANVFAPPSRATSSQKQFMTDFSGDVHQLQCAMESVGLKPGESVSFGYWGYDMNGSPPRLRVIQALLASAAAKLAIHLFVSDGETRDSMDVFYDWLNDRNVAEVYCLYRECIAEAWAEHKIHISGIDHIQMLLDG